MRPTRLLLVVCLLSGGLLADPVRAVPMVFNDEASYLAALTSLGYDGAYEGFEADSVWGSVRSIAGITRTAPSITNFGLTWTSNNRKSGVTTGSGAAFDGKWGFYAFPHGDQPAISDGFVGTSESVIYGVGGWIRTNTPPATIALWLDKGLASEQQVDFGENARLIGTEFAFFGVIEPDGFTRFDYLETEFDPDEQKFIYGDDFTLAMAVPEASSMLSIGSALLFIVGRRCKSVGGARRAIARRPTEGNSTG